MINNEAVKTSEHPPNYVSRAPHSSAGLMNFDGLLRISTGFAIGAAGVGGELSFYQTPTIDRAS